MALAAAARSLPTARTQAPSGPGFRRLAIAAAVFTYGLIVAGAVVRVTGSGLGCPDWPTCHGSIIPPPDPAAWIEWTHRTIAAITSPLILGVTVGAWLVRRQDRGVLTLATLLPVVLAVQILLGRVVVLLELPTMVVLVHLTFALAILGMLVWIAAVAGPPPALRPTPTPAPGRRFQPLVAASTVLVFGLLVVGAYVRATGASWACAGFPACNDQGLLPLGSSALVDLHLFHRLLAYAAVALVGWIVVEARRTEQHVPALQAATAALAGAILLQAGFGAVAVSTGVPPLLQALHVAGAAATWSAMVVVACLTYRVARLEGATVDRDSVGTTGASQPGAGPGGSGAAVAGRSSAGASAEPPAARSTTPGSLLGAYVALTKPRVMSLLLATTLCAMVIAAGQVPPLGLVLWTMIGGALASGGAGAINHYLDRDIDPLMGRTAWRPIPSGRVAPLHALWYGLILGALSALVYMVFVNVLSAVLALVGLVGYTVVYTMWLKRSTPSNIIIGGAAGAVPPLVGWAAVTNEVGLTALYLFAIVFFWTPPHFWALALLIRQHYERARIPMLPVVRGEDETRRQIVLYSLLLVALTLVLFSFRLMGLFYLLAAVILGGLFLVYALRLWREATAAAARRLYTYSILYLAALFAAMAVDRTAFIG